MCGLAGFAATSKVLNEVSAEHIMKKMDAAILHRGPDHGQNWFQAESGVGLVHRRLAIVDLSAEGHQPKFSHCKRYLTVFNGEIYNYKELKSELEKKGHAFVGTSDTEVMLAAFTEYGVENSLPLFNGMFVIVVYDLENQTITFARDRVGKKPLYYSIQDENLVFGSELSVLKSFPNYRAQIDPESFALYMKYSFVPAPRTIFKNTKQLLPGTCVVFSLRSRSFVTEPKAFWSMSRVAEAGKVNPFQGSFEEAMQELDQLIADATRIRMQMDVPWGAFLSGGIDSSLVVAHMQTLSSTPVRTFTIGYHETQFSESDHAKRVAEYLGTEHTQWLVTPKDAMQCIPNLGEIFDEPMSDASQIPTYLVSKLTRQEVTVALSGDGGDEFFAGYHRHFYASKLSLLRKMFPGSLARVLGPVAKSISTHLPHDRYERSLRLLAVSDLNALYSELAMNWGLPDSIFNFKPEFKLSELWDTHGYSSPVLSEQFMLRDAIRYLPDDVMVKVDRASMRVALETRAPLLDYRVIEYAWRLPLSFKVKNNHGKHILRELLYQKVPKALVDRPKMGFGVPVGDWLRGPLQSWAEDLLSPDETKKSGLLNSEVVSNVWNEFKSGKNNRLSVVWSALIFQSWYQKQ